MSNPDARKLTELMPAKAAEFVAAGKAGGVALDYLPRTLPIAEKFVKAAPGEAKRMAAYFGEVIRRETKGFWYEQDGVPMVYVGVEPYVDPAAVIHSLLAIGKADAGGTWVDSSKAYCETICRTQRQWLDHAVMGSYPSVTVLRTSMSADAKTAGMVLALVQQAVLSAQLDWSESLDCSEESLDAVERILDAVHKSTLSDPQRLTPELLDSVSKPMGIYIGEIIRRRFGGQWRATADGSFELPYPGTTIHPIARARKRITDGPSENVKMYFNSMQKVIAS
jgi:hypothetical protein